MKISAFTIGQSGEWQSIDASTCTEHRRHTDSIYFIDIEAYEPDEAVEWLKGLGFSKLALKCCHDAGLCTQVVPMADELFFDFSALVDGDELGRMDVSVLCGENLVVTLHQDPLKSLQLEAVDFSDLGLELTMTSLVTILLLTQSARLSRAVRTINDQLEAIDDRLDQDPDEVTTEEILEQKNALWVLDSISAEQSTCFQVLVDIDSEDLRSIGLNAIPGVIAATAQHNYRTVESLEKRLAVLWQRFEMYQQDKTNARLNTLTVISAVFLPLSLVAGIWGMNFDNMPELHLRFAYPAALIGMAAVAGGWSWFFYKRGWFR